MTNCPFIFLIGIGFLLIAVCIYFRFIKFFSGFCSILLVIIGLLRSFAFITLPGLRLDLGCASIRLYCAGCLVCWLCWRIYLFRPLDC
jgi:hypothetical protein